LSELSGPSSGPRAHLFRTSGDVKIQRGGAGAWVKVTKPAHHLLHSGDRIVTMQRANCVVQIDGARISLGPATEVAIPGGQATTPHRGVSRVLADPAWTSVSPAPVTAARLGG